MGEHPAEFEHVGSFAPYGLDGCGALGGVDIYVKAEDTDKGTNYQADDHRLWADNARLRAALVDITEMESADQYEATKVIRMARRAREALALFGRTGAPDA